MNAIFILLFVVQRIAGETTVASNVSFGNPADVTYVEGTAAPEIVAGPASPAAHAYFASTMRPKTGLSQYATSERLITAGYESTPSSRTVYSNSAPITSSTPAGYQNNRGLSRYQTSASYLSDGYVDGPAARTTLQSGQPQSGQTVITIGGTKAHAVNSEGYESTPSSRTIYSSSAPQTATSTVSSYRPNSAVSSTQHYGAYMSDGYSRTVCGVHQPSNQQSGQHSISFGVPVRAAYIAQPTRISVYRNSAPIQPGPAVAAGPIVRSQPIALVHNARYFPQTPGTVDVPVTEIQQHHGVIQKTINVAQPAIKTRKIEIRRPAIRKQFYDIEEHIIVRPAGSVLLELDHPLANTNKGETIVPVGGGYQPGHREHTDAPQPVAPTVHQPAVQQPAAHHPQPTVHQPTVQQPDIHEPSGQSGSQEPDSPQSDIHQPAGQHSPEINIPYGDSTYVVQQPGDDQHHSSVSSSTQPPVYDKYNPLAPTENGHLQQDIIYADDQPASHHPQPTHEVSTTPATFIPSTTSAPPDYDDSIVVEAKQADTNNESHDIYTNSENNETNNFDDSVSNVSAQQAYSQQHGRGDIHSQLNSQHQGYNYDSSQIESERLVQPQQQENNPAGQQVHVNINFPSNAPQQHQALLARTTPRVQYEESFQSQQYPPQVSSKTQSNRLPAYQATQQYRLSQPQPIYQKEQLQQQHQFIVAQDPIQQQRGQLQTYPARQEVDQYGEVRSNSPSYKSQHQAQLRVSYPSSQPQQQVQFRSNYQSLSQEPEQNYQQSAQLNSNLPSNTPQESYSAETFTARTPQRNDAHHRSAQTQQQSYQPQPQNSKPVQQTSQRASFRSQSPHMIAIGQPDFRYPPYVEARSNGAPISTHSNYAVQEKQSDPARGDVSIPSHDQESFPSVTPSPHLTPKQSSDNQKHFLELLFARGKVSEVGFGPTASPQGLAVPASGYIRSRVISATPAPHDAKPADERVHTRRIVISHPFETVQEVEVQEPVTKYQQITVNEPTVYNTATVGLRQIHAGVPVAGHPIHPYAEHPVDVDYHYVH